MNTKDKLFERYRNASDDDVIEIVKHKFDYTDEAVEVATQILNDRQIELPVSEPSPHNIQPEYKSLCGILSAIAPVIGGIGFFLIIHTYPGDPCGFGGAFPATAFLFASLLFGVIIGIIGLFRREKFKSLGVVALMINALPILGVIFFIIGRI